VRELTSKENKWLDELQEVFSRCPDTLDFVTIGDPDLTVVCRKECAVTEFDGMGVPENLPLRYISTGGHIHSTTG